MSTETNAPDWTNWYTVDAAAECIEYQDHLPAGQDWRDLYRKLWSYVPAEDVAPEVRENLTSQAEYLDATPCPTLADVWDDLTDMEQVAFLLAKTAQDAYFAEITAEEHSE